MPRFLRALVIFLIGMSYLSSGCSTSGKWHSRRYDLRHLPHTDMPIVVNQRVIAWMEYFQGPGRGHFQRYMERSGKYRAFMQQILRQEGMPEDIVYLSLIESGFNPNARSRANAVGAWQFIRSTGRHYGLEVDTWVDERRDVEKATHAAASYLRNLYDEFGDWYLAMAAYNAGEGRVRKAINIGESKDFWDLTAPGTHYFRPETRDYVPKYLAATIIAKEPEKFGFRRIAYEKPLEFDTVHIETQTDLKVVAKCAGVSSADVRELNPHLIRFATPHNEKNYPVRIPKGTITQFEVAYAQLPAEERVKIAYHRVVSGDSLYHIARHYGVTTRDLARANNIRNNRKIFPGQKLIVPVKGTDFAALEESVTMPVKPRRIHAEKKTILSLPTSQVARAEVAKMRPLTHTVRSGETLWGIARKYRIRVSELVAMNSLSTQSKIHPGEKLTITQGSSPREEKVRSTAEFEVREVGDLASVTPSYISYRVKSGDTLWDISKKYGVSISDLKSWNSLNNPKRVKPGTELKIRVAENH